MVTGSETQLYILSGREVASRTNGKLANMTHPPFTLGDNKKDRPTVQLHMGKRPGWEFTATIVLQTGGD